MASFDFPPNPTIGQNYTLNGVTYVWNGYAWVGSSSAVDPGAGVPEAPNDGQVYVRGSLTWSPSNWATLSGKPTTFPPSSHTHPASEISDSTTVGRAVITATDQAAARSAIGAISQNDQARVGVRDDGVMIAARRNLNFLDGTGTTVTVADNSASEEVTIRIDASGGGGGGIPEAPIDGKSYGRRDGDWDHVVSHANDIIDGGNF